MTTIARHICFSPVLCNIARNIAEIGTSVSIFLILIIWIYTVVTLRFLKTVLFYIFILFHRVQENQVFILKFTLLEFPAEEEFVYVKKLVNSSKLFMTQYYILSFHHSPGSISFYTSRKLSNRKYSKGTVSVILSDTSCKDGNIWFTKKAMKPLSN